MPLSFFSSTGAPVFGPTGNQVDFESLIKYQNYVGRKKHLVKVRFERWVPVK